MSGVASVNHAPQILGALSKPEERDLRLTEMPFHLGPRGAAQDFDPHRLGTGNARRNEIATHHPDE
jgi:hypothetical protein